MGEPLYQDNTGPGDFSHAESSCQESFKMRIILLLTVFTTLGLCQRQSPPSTPLTEPPQGQRCAGRNFNGRRCCTPESPCGYGEGDCDGPLDGGANDGHRGCQGDLVCGSNNCKKFGTYFHEKDDCCDLPETLAIPEPLPLIPAGVPLEPPAGQRCAGRNYNGKRCCTPENPCDEGEGDCDGPGDGGNNDGHRGCKGDLICGSNNCLQFGAYCHPKDDCCERPQGVSLAGGAGSGNVRQQQYGWGPWSNWTACRRVHQQISGRCRKTRTRNCVGPQCGSLQHSEDLQEQYCRESDCDAEGFAEDERFFF